MSLWAAIVARRILLWFALFLPAVGLSFWSAAASHRIDTLFGSTCALAMWCVWFVDVMRTRQRNFRLSSDVVVSVLLGAFTLCVPVTALLLLDAALFHGSSIATIITWFIVGIITARLIFIYTSVGKDGFTPAYSWKLTRGANIVPAFAVVFLMGLLRAAADRLVHAALYAFPFIPNSLNHVLPVAAESLLAPLGLLLAFELMEYFERGERSMAIAEGP